MRLFAVGVVDLRVCVSTEHSLNKALENRFKPSQ